MFLLFQKNKFTIKSFVFKVISYLLIFVLFTYVIDVLLTGVHTKYEYIDIYNHCDFDVEIFDPNVEYYNDVIANQDFVENSLKCVNTGGDLLHNGEYGIASVINIDAENFEVLFDFFPKELFISIDESLLSRKDGIFLSFYIAESRGIEVGDSVAISGREKVVVGTFENGLVNILHMDGITLVDDKMYEQVGKITENFYNEVLLQVSDIEAAKEYFETKYFRHSMLIESIFGLEQEDFYAEKYGDDWMRKLIDEYSENSSLMQDYNRNNFITKATMKAYSIDAYKSVYNLNKDYTYSVISIIAIFSICVMESYRHAKENQQKIAILRMMGCSRYSISTFYFVRSFVLQTILMLCGTIFVKYIRNRTMCISNALAIQWIMYFEVVIFIAALISTVVSMRKLSDKALLFSLNEEGSVD